MNSMTIARRLASLLLASSLAAAAAAQSYPDRPVRLVVPFAAGSTTDVISRIVAQELSKNIGQPVVVDPRPGANGTIAVAAVAKAAADG
jgi:tripartite-type tricarboxylate transporter receptor subunit TctC